MRHEEEQAVGAGEPIDHTWERLLWECCRTACTEVLDLFLCSDPRTLLVLSINDQVGDPNLDHQCWIRPENMKAPRTLYEINEKTPGTEIAAETAAAMASSSMVFRGHDKKYSRSLLNKAKMVRDAPRPFICN
jgi:hypothetical protein